LVKIAILLVVITLFIVVFNNLQWYILEMRTHRSLCGWTSGGNINCNFRQCRVFRWRPNVI